MADVEQERCQKGRHNVQIWKMLHQFAHFCHVMEISCYFDRSCDIMVAISFIGSCFHFFHQVREILVTDGELV